MKLTARTLLGPFVIAAALIGSAPLLRGQNTDRTKVAPSIRPVVVTEQIANAKEPQVAIGTKDRVYVAFGAENSVYVSVSTDGGATYGTPTRVTQTGRLALGMRRGPRIVATATGAVVTAIYGNKGGGSDGELLAWSTADGGKTWRGPVTVTDVPGAAREGLHAMAIAPNGMIACAWLDLRQPGTQIYASFSQDGGTSWRRNVRVYQSPDGTVCECCHPSLTFDAQNRCYVMWRNWLGGARDMYLASSDGPGNSFTAAQKLGTGTWPLNACPMDGGAVASSKQDGLLTFWRRQNVMYLASVTKPGRPGPMEQMVGTGQQGWIASTSAGAYLVWLRDRPGRLLARLPQSSTPFTLAESADDPTVSAGEKQDGNATVVAAWSDERGIRAATLATDK